MKPHSGKSLLNSHRSSRIVSISGMVVLDLIACIRFKLSDSKRIFSICKFLDTIIASLNDIASPASGEEQSLLEVEAVRSFPSWFLKATADELYAKYRILKKEIIPYEELRNIRREVQSSPLTPPHFNIVTLGMSRAVSIGSDTLPILTLISVPSPRSSTSLYDGRPPTSHSQLVAITDCWPTLRSLSQIRRHPTHRRLFVLHLSACLTSPPRCPRLLALPPPRCYLVVIAHRLLVVLESLPHHHAVLDSSARSRPHRRRSLPPRLRRL
ncbi:hypothetical protein PIB30_021672 [Stylosanthes scabra]|uniref:Uncharacterized protein n=1 Tax=Stylosanthes scabra TaxID=79078 RepID=A0ABU6Z6J2_9FABA|nr:hypothetical protein [Stylosanthes scabra]